MTVGWYLVVCYLEKLHSCTLLIYIHSSGKNSVKALKQQHCLI